MVFCAFCLLLYFLPSIIAHQKQSFGAIFVINLFLGWTVIGWVVALIWACTDAPRCAPVYAVHGPNHYCSRCGALGPAVAQFCWACGARL